MEPRASYHTQRFNFSRVDNKSSDFKLYGPYEKVSNQISAIYWQDTMIISDIRCHADHMCCSIQFSYIPNPKCWYSICGGCHGNSDITPRSLFFSPSTPINILGHIIRNRQVLKFRVYDVLMEDYNKRQGSILKKIAFFCVCTVYTYRGTYVDWYSLVLKQSLTSQLSFDTGPTYLR